MKADQIVVSRDTAEKLKAKGWNKPTVFVWSDGRLIHGYNSDGSLANLLALDFPAPTLAEVLEELPAQIQKTGERLFLTGGKYADGKFYYSFDTRHDFIALHQDKNPAEAAAMLWLWLVENKYI